MYYKLKQFSIKKHVGNPGKLYASALQFSFGGVSQKLNELWASSGCLSRVPPSPISLSTTFYNTVSLCFLCNRESSSSLQIAVRTVPKLCLYRICSIYYNFVYLDALELPITQRGCARGGVLN